MSVLGLIMSFSPYLRSALVRFPLPNPLTIYFVLPGIIPAMNAVSPGPDALEEGPEVAGIV